jgi:hypothetical protein
VQDARHRGDVCQPLVWIPEAHHALGGGEAVIPDALFYYRKGADGRGVMLRAFVEVDRATMGPERLGAKLGAYARLHSHVPTPAPGTRRRQIGLEPLQEEWRRHYPLFPRLLFVLDGTGPAGVDNRIRALRTAACQLTPDALPGVPVLAAALTDILRNGPLRTRLAPPSRTPTNSSTGATDIARRAVVELRTVVVRAAHGHSRSCGGRPTRPCADPDQGHYDPDHASQRTGRSPVRQFGRCLWRWCGACQERAASSTVCRISRRLSTPVILQIR